MLPEEDVFAEFISVLRCFSRIVIIHTSRFHYILVDDICQVMSQASYKGLRDTATFKLS